MVTNDFLVFLSFMPKSFTSEPSTYEQGATGLSNSKSSNPSAAIASTTAAQATVNGHHSPSTNGSPKPTGSRLVQGSLSQTDEFTDRHIGPGATELDEMLTELGFSSLEALIDQAVPPGIRLQRPLQLEEGRSEYEL